MLTQIPQARVHYGASDTPPTPDPFVYMWRSAAICQRWCLGSMAKFMGTLTRSASEVGLVEMLTPSASEVGLVLSVSNVMDCSLKSLIVVDPSSAAAFRPPLFSYGWIVSSETPSSRLEILQSARRPSLELYLHPFRFNWCRDDDMKVISSAIHNVELPAAGSATVVH